MGISKSWLQEKIKQAEADAKGSDVQFESFHNGKQEAFTQCFEQLTMAPGPKKLTDIDVNKGYDSIVKYYMDKKGYTKEHANEIAMKCIEDQKQKVLEQN